jgi:hypothetical protein
MRQALPIHHVAAIEEHPCWCAWPHDGSIKDFGSGQTFMIRYKKLGLHMLPTHATFASGGAKRRNGNVE